MAKELKGELPGPNLGRSLPLLRGEFTQSRTIKRGIGSVNVAKVDGAAQRALAARFPLRGFPSIFQCVFRARSGELPAGALAFRTIYSSCSVKDGEVREYEGGCVLLRLPGCYPFRRARDRADAMMDPPRRTKDAILAFAKEDWDQLEPLGETSSPFGILCVPARLLHRWWWPALPVDCSPRQGHGAWPASGAGRPMACVITWD